MPAFLFAVGLLLLFGWGSLELTKLFSVLLIVLECDEFTFIGVFSVCRIPRAMGTHP